MVGLRQYSILHLFSPSLRAAIVRFMKGSSMALCDLALSELNFP